MPKRITLSQVSKQIKEGFERVNNKLSNFEDKLYNFENKLSSFGGELVEIEIQNFSRKPVLKLPIRRPQLDIVSNSYVEMPDYGPTSITVRG